MLISKEEFWNILEGRCKEPYTSGLINSVSKLLPFGDKDDIMADCYIHFIKEDCLRLSKIRNENGAKISITNRLRDVYRKNKVKVKHITRIEDRYTDEENKSLNSITYTDFQKRLCYFAIGRTRQLHQLNLGETKDKDGRRSPYWLKTELVALIVKTDRKYRKVIESDEFMEWANISEEAMNLLLYLKSGDKFSKKYNVDRRFFRNKIVNSVNPASAINNELKSIYQCMMDIIFREVR